MGSIVNKRRIAFVIGSMGRGGAERVISILANSYAESGWEVDILCLLDSKCDYELSKSIRIVDISNSKKSRIKNLPEWIFGLRNYIKTQNPYRIVSFIARINILTIFANIGIGKKLIISERNDPKSDGRSIGVKIATYILYPLAETIVFQTKWAKSCFPKYIREKGVIIPNPVDVGIKATKHKKNKIVAVGRLIEQKNHKLLIDAFAKVIEKYPDYELNIYGEGRLRNELTNQIHKLNLSDKIFLMGNVVDVHEKIADAKLFVLSSDYEGLSNALLEAMSMGIPCLSSNCAGSNEVIKHGVNGLLFPVKDVDALYESIIYIVENKDIACKIGENAKVSLTKYKSEVVIDDWQKTVEGISF